MGVFGRTYREGGRRRAWAGRSWRRTVSRLWTRACSIKSVRRRHLLRRKSRDQKRGGGDGPRRTRSGTSVCGGWTAGYGQKVGVGRGRERPGARAHAEHVCREQRLVLSLLLLLGRRLLRRPFRIPRDGDVVDAYARAAPAGQV